MVFNANFNNITVIYIVGGNRSTQRKPQTCRKSLTNLITQFCIEYTSPSAVFELSILVIKGTDCIGSCKSNYHTVITIMTPINLLGQILL